MEVEEEKKAEVRWILDPEQFKKLLFYVLSTKFKYPHLGIKNCKTHLSPDHKWAIWEQYDYDGADSQFDCSTLNLDYYLFLLSDSKIDYLGSFYYEQCSTWGGRGDYEHGSTFQWKNDAVLKFTNPKFKEMNLNVLDKETIQNLLNKNFGKKNSDVTPNELNVIFDDYLIEEMKEYERVKELERIEQEKKRQEALENQKINLLIYEEKRKKEWEDGREEREKQFALAKKKKQEENANSFVERNKRAVSGYSAIREKKMIASKKK